MFAAVLPAALMPILLLRCTSTHVAEQSAWALGKFTKTNFQERKLEGGNKPRRTAHSVTGINCMHVLGSNHMYVDPCRRSVAIMQRFTTLVAASGEGIAKTAMFSDDSLGFL